MSIRIRFVLSGACHPSYSGRQLQLEVPLVSETGEQTTIKQIKDIIRSEWPSDLSEMKDSINTTEMRLLKTGNLISDDTALIKILTSVEAQECRVGAPAPAREEEEPKSVLMHLVFQKPRATAKREKENNNNKTNVRGRKDHSVSDSGCCCIM